jgi:cell division protein FtsL
MKKSVKPVIVLFLFVLVVFAVVILGYVGVKLECEQLTKQKVLSQEKLVAVKNMKVNLTAEVQFLSSEERIVTIAQSELGLIKRTESRIALTIDKSKVEELDNFLKEKYE